MRKRYYSRKSRHIVKFSSLIAAALLNCASSQANDSSTKKLVAIPSADLTTYIYNGSLQTYTIAEDTLYSVFGNSHTKAGEYEVTVSLNNTTISEWEDGSVEPKTYTFTINKLQVEIPAADSSMFVYNGEQQFYSIPASEYYTADGYNKTYAGNYNVVVSLNDTINCEWADSTTTNKTYNFAIGKAQIEIPSADTSKFTYNGAMQVYVIKPSIDYSVSGNVQNNAGTHTVTVSLANSDNYEWTDGTSENKTYDFVISKAPIAIPTVVKDTFEYDGHAKFFEIESNSKYSIDILNEIGVEIGTYNRTVSINDGDNYIWEDGTSEPKNITFVITEKKVKIPVVKNFVYTGETFKLIPESDCYTIDNGEGSNAGVYDVVLTLAPGNIWEDGTQDAIHLPVTIDAIPVEKPAVYSSKVTYDGTTYTVKVPENQAYTISGQSTGIFPGTYTSTVTLNPNYAWDDNTTDTLRYQLIIEKIRIAIPSADTTTFYYNQKEQTYNIAESNLYTVKGNKQSTIGTHDVIVELKNTSYYEWTDSTTEIKHYQFDIIETDGFAVDITKVDAAISSGEDITINLDVDGMIQYYKVSCSLLPELKDSLIEFDNESSTIKIPTSKSAAAGKYIMNITLMSGKTDTSFIVDVTINYPASDIIVCWNDVVAVDGSKVKATTYQWYKDGELIPGATSQYYCDNDGLCGYYMCEVDGSIFVGPIYLDFGKPLYITAHGESGKIVANVVGNTSEKVLLMSIGGSIIEKKPAAEEITFYVKPGIYILTLDGTDQSVKVIVK